MNTFETLNSVNVSDKTEKKNGLTYLSWAWAWGEFKKRYPESYYTIYENEHGYNYFTDGRTCWVKTGVTLVDGDKSLELIEYLPVMDYKNRSIAADAVTSFDVNKSIQRSLTKAVARHGLGLYIYAGEDLPEQTAAQKAAPEEKVNCSDCGLEITSVTRKDGSMWPVHDMVTYSSGRFGRPLCALCMKNAQKKEARDEDKREKARQALQADAEAHPA